MIFAFSRVLSKGKQASGFGMIEVRIFATPKTKKFSLGFQDRLTGHDHLPFDFLVSLDSLETRRILGFILKGQPIHTLYTNFGFARNCSAY